MYDFNSSLGQAYYYYEIYRRETIAKGEKPLTMMQLLFEK